MKRILVAEDDIVMVRLFQHHLKREGFDVVVYQDGHAVMQAVAKQAPDLMVLDYMLPGKSGLEIIVEMKKDKRLSKIPLIVVTGYGKISIREGLLEAGADVVFTKPFSPVLLVKQINKLLPSEGKSP